MSKFNLFDPKSWQPDPVDQETIIRNKALGAMGGMISRIRDLKIKIESKSSIDEQEDYKLAQFLNAKNIKAFQAMEIKYHFTDDKIHQVLKSINYILDTWQNSDNRNSYWKTLIQPLQDLQPFINDERSMYFTSYFNDEEIRKLGAVIVSGNEAWKEYLEMNRQFNFVKDDCKEMQSRIDRFKTLLDDVESTDDLDDEENDEDND
jgi:hypothetical protein